MVIYIALILLIIPFSFAEEININKSAPSEIKLGSILEVEIEILNSGSEKNITVIEVINGAEPIDPPEFHNLSTPEDLIASPPPQFRWNFILESGSEKTINYEVKPTSPGEYIISPTRVKFDNQSISSETLTVSIICNKNGACESEKCENYFNCPEDCPSGSNDGVCDLIDDGKCDPDCEKGADPDCKEEVCNQNGICEPERGENYKNCSEDCPSGSEDGYCDGLEDGICDPDCMDINDPDCEVEKDKCNKNGKCEPGEGENYKNCKEDCPSGSQDNYCDGISDGTCDPDCEIDQDPDCGGQEFEIPLWAYIIIGGVVLFIIFVLFTSMKVEK